MQLRFLDFNYLFQSNVSLTASSSDSEFPVTNLAKTIRSSVWRSNATGNFVIDATNNKINFQEVNAGTIYTATITSGTYTSPTLATEIVTRMGAAGGTGVYTVSKSSLTGLWTIATNLAYLKILWLTGTNTATTIGPSIGFSKLSDSNGALTYTGSNVAIHTEESIVIDLKTAEPIDSFCLFFDAVTGINLSANAVLTIQGNATNLWTSPALSQVVTIDTAFNCANYFWSVAQNYRYFRLKIVDPANANLYVQLSKIVLTQGTQFNVMQRNGWKWTLNDQTEIQRTPFGQEYADLYPVQKMVDLDLFGLTYANTKVLDSMYRTVGRTIPVTICIDPLGEFYSPNHYVLYGTFQSTPSGMQLVGNYFDYALSFGEVF